MTMMDGFAELSSCLPP